VEKILVVDDLPYNQEILDTELRKLGYETLLASDGAAALEQVQSGEPDLVLMDISMPGLDGLEVLKLLRADTRHSRLPIILLTGKKGSEDKIEDLDAGADDYITKPFSMKEVAARIRVQLRIVTLERQIVQQERGLAQITGIGQTLVTLAHYINNATQAISGMAQLCQAAPENRNQQESLVRTALKQSERISAVLDALQVMVDGMEVRTVDYAGDPDRMLDIEREVEKRLKRLNEES
jgi:DNA-binding response OmpR family regulator